MIDHRRLYGPQGIEFVHADCETHDLGAYSPDVIVSFETIEHIRNPSYFLYRIRTGLRKDDLFIVSRPNNEKVGNNRFHLHSWDLSLLKNRLEEHFSEVVVLGNLADSSLKCNGVMTRV